jgi:hypothetical protein
MGINNFGWRLRVCFHACFLGNSVRFTRDINGGLTVIRFKRVFRAIGTAILFDRILSGFRPTTFPL